MAETTADVRRDIELTRDRISSTLSQLEQKVHVTQIVRDNPWPALGLALGAGFLLSGSHVDVRAAATTVAATRGASSKLGTVLDDMVANLMGGLSAAFEQRVEGLVTELKSAIGAPINSGNGTPGTSSGFMSSQPASGSQQPSQAGSQGMGGGMSGGQPSTAGSSGLSANPSLANTGSFAAAPGTDVPYSTPRAD